MQLTQVTSGVSSLVGIEHAGDGSGRLFLVSQAGKIFVYNGTNVLTTPFLDISSLVRFSGEQGLLGLAFHPSYETNGLFFVSYVSLVNSTPRTVIARYQVSGNADIADAGSGAILLTQDHPFDNHKGGQIRFGPDGFLYVAIGDGGSGGDPQNNGQRLDTLLGKILRIDVNTGSPYGIPPGNPFVGTAGARPEIWSYGLRNPWRFTFDRQTGEMFIADVGQGLWEEINIEPAATGGRNYGWRRMEGLHCYSPSTSCDTGNFVLPIIEYPHALGCSVTGGFRNRGTALPAYAGAYFFGDYCSGRIWAATRNGDGTWSSVQLLDSPVSITTFGEDEAGGLYVGHQNGTVYRLLPAASAQPRLTITKNGNGTALIDSNPAAIYCPTICAEEGTTGAITLTVTPATGTSFWGWSGDPDCSDGVVTLTASRNCVAHLSATGFTDATLVSTATVIKAVHVTELRARIDAQRVRYGLSPAVWTDPQLAAQSTPVRVLHVTEMRTALTAAFTAAKRTPPVYTDSPLGAGTPIRAIHITDLRAAVVALEGS